MTDPTTVLVAVISALAGALVSLAGKSLRDRRRNGGNTDSHVVQVDVVQVVEALRLQLREERTRELDILRAEIVRLRDSIHDLRDALNPMLARLSVAEHRIDELRERRR